MNNFYLSLLSTQDDQLSHNAGDKEVRKNKTLCQINKAINRQTQI